jgi:uncharacterized Zn-finger protein
LLRIKKSRIPSQGFVHPLVTPALLAAITASPARRRASRQVKMPSPTPSRKPHVCATCQSKYATKIGLMDHTRVKHSAPASCQKQPNIKTNKKQHAQNQHTLCAAPQGQGATTSPAQQEHPQAQLYQVGAFQAATMPLAPNAQAAHALC